MRFFYHRGRDEVDYDDVENGTQLSEEEAAALSLAQLVVEVRELKSELQEVKGLIYERGSAG